MEPFALLLVLIPVLSPLLTLAWLWQVKEWRLDRIQEHFRSQGFFRQLFGRSRPIMIGIYLSVLLVLLLLSNRDNAERVSSWAGFWILGILIALAGISVIQLLSGRQRMPKWTAKAISMVGVSVLLTLFLAWVFFINPLTTPLLPLISLLVPLILLGAWLLLVPLDTVLKQRILTQAMALRSQYTITAIGVTGSVGKTTTKEVLAHMLSAQKPLVTPEYVNTEMGIAQWLLRELPKHSVQKPLLLIAEMGAYRKGEIAILARIVQPSLGIVTFVGTQHLALFGSQQNLMEAKAELLQALPKSGHAFINTDCDLCKSMTQFCACPITTVSAHGKADMSATNIHETSEGFSFTAMNTAFNIPLHGTHNVTNVLLAIAAAKTLGMSATDIQKTVESFKGPNATFSVRTERGIRIVDDTHNASVTSLMAAIAWAKTQPEKQKILIATGVIELGPIEKVIHKELGEKAKDVFHEAVILHPTYAPAFQLGFGKSLASLMELRPLAAGTLLVCVGRMPSYVITDILPSDHTKVPATRS